MTEHEARELRPGEIVLLHGEACEIVRVYRNPVVIECRDIGMEFAHLHFVRAGKCRRLQQ